MKNTLIWMLLLIILMVGCEKENSTPLKDVDVVKIDTLNYREVLRTTDNFFGITNLYSKKMMNDTDTTMQITSVRVLHFTGPEVLKTASIHLNVSIPIPYQLDPERLNATGECIIIADKGHYLFKGGLYSKVIMEGENGSLNCDTSKMDKIITGQTIKISPIYETSSQYNFLCIESRKHLNMLSPITTEKIIESINSGIDLFRENATSFTMKVMNNNFVERVINSTSEINQLTDGQLTIVASYRSNFVSPVFPDTETMLYSLWKSRSGPMVLLIGR